MNLHTPAHVTCGPDPGAAAYRIPPDAAPGMSLMREGLSMREGGRAGNSGRTNRTTPRATVGPSWRSMSDEICSDCRARYLPLVGRCVCVGGYP